MKALIAISLMLGFILWLGLVLSKGLEFTAITLTPWIGIIIIFMLSYEDNIDIKGG